MVKWSHDKTSCALFLTKYLILKRKFKKIRYSAFSQDLGSESIKNNFCTKHCNLVSYKSKLLISRTLSNCLFHLGGIYV